MGVGGEPLLIATRLPGVLQFPKQTTWFGSCKYKVKKLAKQSKRANQKILAKKPLGHKSLLRRLLETAAYYILCAHQCMPCDSDAKSQEINHAPLKVNNLSRLLHLPILTGLRTSTKTPPTYDSSPQSHRMVRVQKDLKMI